MKRKLRNSLLAITAAMLTLVSCGEDKRSDVIPPKKLESILYDYHLAQVMISDLPSSERYKKDLYFDYIYDKHGVTKDQIDSSLVYYARYPEDLSDIYTRLSSHIERNIQHIEHEKQLAKVRSAKAVEGDSADLWYDTRLIQLHPSELTNHFSFIIPNDTNFKANDRLAWNGEVQFLHAEADSLNRYLQLAFTAEFANDSLLSVDTVLYTTGSFHLQIADTAGMQLNKLYGNVYYKNNDTVTSGVLLHQIELMRYRYIEPTNTLFTDSIHTRIDSVTVTDASIPTEQEERK